jgi:O-acetylserine/cysteine efflux transporter
MSPLHIAAAVFVAFVWGTNFVAIKLSYQCFQPFSLLFVRFFLSAFPMIFFVPLPKTAWREMLYISLFLWIGQFSFLFTAVYLGASPGLSSMLLQSQNLMTLVLSMVFMHYKPKKVEVIGIITAFMGIAAIAWDQSHYGKLLPLLLTFPAALCVSLANLIMAKTKSHPKQTLGIIVWSNVIPLPVMLLASVFFEGPNAIADAVLSITAIPLISIFFTAYISTVIATTVWANLIKTHTPPVVVPFTLLIPVFSMGAASFFLDEQYSTFSLGACGLVLLGLAINQYGKRPKKADLLRKVI